MISRTNVKELNYTFRFFEHIRLVTIAHFKLSDGLQHVLSIEDGETYKAYITDLLVTSPNDAHLTKEQSYLLTLGAIVHPALSAHRIRNRLRGLQPRTHALNPSANLEECGKRLSMEAYHFKERIRLFGDNAIALSIDPIFAGNFGKTIGRILRNFQHENLKLLKFRNFVVHGPKGRIDEFADLRSWELSAILLHSDIWLEYKNQFEGVRSEWNQIGGKLIRSMESTIAAVQLANENAIESRSLSFSAERRDRLN
jgi:hypothetical protein